MAGKQKEEQDRRVRVSAMVVMDQAVLERARAKAEQHGVSLPYYLERAVRLYGKFLDKKITVIARPI